MQAPFRVATDETWEVQVERAPYTKHMPLRLRTRRRTVRRSLTAEQKQRREMARRMIMERVVRWSAEMNIQPNRVAIRDQRTRWGSASSLGNLNFSWRVAAMPDEIQDYIAIHELAHLKEMNHSAQFWAIVGEYDADYRAHRKWLREHGGRYHRTLQ